MPVDKEKAYRYASYQKKRCLVHRKTIAMASPLKVGAVSSVSSVMQDMTVQDTMQKLAVQAAMRKRAMDAQNKKLMAKGQVLRQDFRSFMNTPKNMAATSPLKWLHAISVAKNKT